MIKTLKKDSEQPRKSNSRKGSVFVEYILLITLVGLGVIVGLACVREALVGELNDLADAIEAISC